MEWPRLGQNFEGNFGRAEKKKHVALRDFCTNSAFAQGPRKTSENSERICRSQENLKAYCILSSNPDFEFKKQHIVSPYICILLHSIKSLSSLMETPLCYLSGKDWIFICNLYKWHSSKKSIKINYVNYFSVSNRAKRWRHICASQIDRIKKSSLSTPWRRMEE